MADRITTSTCRLSSSAITTISEPTRVPTTATVPRSARATLQPFHGAVDGIHPTQKGATLLAKIIMEAITKK